MSTLKSEDFNEPWQRLFRRKIAYGPVDMTGKRFKTLADHIVMFVIPGRLISFRPALLGDLK